MRFHIKIGDLIIYPNVSLTYILSISPFNDEAVGLTLRNHFGAVFEKQFLYLPVLQAHIADEICFIQSYDQS